MWDFYIDFGMFRCFKPGKYWGLRENILFPVWFYWFITGYDFFARFFWIIPVFKWS